MQYLIKIKIRMNTQVNSQKFLKSKMENIMNTCPICLEEPSDVSSILDKCKHLICINCLPGIIFFGDFPKYCPLCRALISNILFVKFEDVQQVVKDLNQVNITNIYPFPFDKKIVILPGPLCVAKESSILIRTIDVGIIGKYVFRFLTSCVMCSYTNICFYCLLKHMTMVHNLFRCDICPLMPKFFPKFYTVYSIEDLRRHKRLYHSSRSSEMFRTLQYLIRRNRMMRPFDTRTLSY